MKLQDSAKGRRKLDCQVEGEVRNPVQKGLCCLITKFWLTLSLFWSSGTVLDVTVGLEGYGRMVSNDISIDADNILCMWAHYPAPWVTVLASMHFLFFRQVMVLYAEFQDNLPQMLLTIEKWLLLSVFVLCWVQVSIKYFTKQCAECWENVPCFPAVVENLCVLVSKEG